MKRHTWKRLNKQKSAGKTKPFLRKFELSTAKQGVCQPAGSPLYAHRVSLMKVYLMCRGEDKAMFGICPEHFEVVVLEAVVEQKPRH
jgi:hypothetical protein